MILEEPTSMGSISMNFKVFLESELRIHQQISEANLRALEEKVEMVIKCLKDFLAKDVTSNLVLELQEQIEEWMREQQKSADIAGSLREVTEKEKHLQKELARLKSRLRELEKKKCLYEKENKGMSQESKEDIAALKKIIRYYSTNFSMELSVIDETSEDKIVCRVCFKERPDCWAFFEIDRDKNEVTAFRTEGILVADEENLKTRFMDHRNPSQLLADFRNLVVKTN